MAKKTNGDAVRKAILQFIVKYMEANSGRSPSIQEICDGLNIPSKSHVHYHLKSLEEKKVLERPKNEARGIRILQNQMDGFSLRTGRTYLPVREGIIAAGPPLANLDAASQETIAVDMLDLPK